MSAISSVSFIWTLATLADAPAVLELMQAFYGEEGLVFDGPNQGRALDALLADPSLGSVFLLRAVGTIPEAGAMGHLVLTRGHSLEFGGRFLLLDELYLTPGIRGRGEGARAISFAATQARASGTRALRLEVSQENRRASAAYLQAGFVKEKRDLMTLRLD